MGKAAVLHPEAQQRRHRAAALLAEPLVRRRIDAQRAQRHDHLRGALGILRAPGGKAAVGALRRAQRRQRPVNDLCLPVRIGRQRLQSHGRNIRVQRIAGQRKPAVLALRRYDGLDDRLSGIPRALRRLIPSGIQRQQREDPSVQPLCAGAALYHAVIAAVRDQVDGCAVRLRAEGRGIAAQRRHRQRHAVPLRGFVGGQTAAFRIGTLHIGLQRRQVRLIVLTDAAARHGDGVPVRHGGLARRQHVLPCQQRLAIGQLLPLGFHKLPLHLRVVRLLRPRRRHRARRHTKAAYPRRQPSDRFPHSVVSSSFFLPHTEHTPSSLYVCSPVAGSVTVPSHRTCVPPMLPTAR